MFLVPSREDLQPHLDAALHESGLSESEYIAHTVDQMVQVIKARPTIYRSYGAYWWAVKRIMIEHGVIVFGQTVEIGDIEQFFIENDEALTLVAAILYQQWIVNNASPDVADHLLPLVDGDDVEYSVIDDEMEFLIAGEKTK